MKRALPAFCYKKGKAGYVYFVRGGTCQRIKATPGTAGGTDSMGDDLINRLAITSGMLQMGDRPRWGVDSAIMAEAAAALAAKDAEIAVLRWALAFYAEGSRYQATTGTLRADGTVNLDRPEIVREGGGLARYVLGDIDMAEAASRLRAALGPAAQTPPE